MKSGLQQLMVSGMLMAASLANAADVVVPTGGSYNGARIGGVSTLAFSTDMLYGFDTTRTAVTSYGTGAATAVKDSDGYYTEVAATMPIASLTFDSSNSALRGFAASGGLTLSTPVMRNVSTGGSLTITDLNVDLAGKLVYATLIGANGVGTLSHVPLWNISDISVGAPYIGFDSSCGIYNDCQFTAPNLSLTGLFWTSEGLSATTQSLGLARVGLSSLAVVQDIATITTSAVPEPATFALMALGLAGIWATTRRRHQSCQA
jgi:hypothetical protein